MNIHTVNKDITTIDQGIILHGCNCQGVMNGGVAKAIRKQWPVVYDSYIAFLNKHEPDDLLGRSDQCQINQHITVINGFTQFNYGNDGKQYASVAAIRQCLISAMLITLMHRHTRSLYMPKIGCGLGGLNYENDLEPIITNRKYQFIDIDLYICDI